MKAPALVCIHDKRQRGLCFACRDVVEGLVRAESEAQKKLVEQLLEACREALEWPDEDEYGKAFNEKYATPAYRAYRARLRDAIAKAEGR